MATKANRAATASSKQGGKSKTRNRTTYSYRSDQKLDSPRNQRVFEAHQKESLARRRNFTSAEPPDRLQRTRRASGPPRVGDPAIAQLDQPKYRKKKQPSGRGISGGRIYVSAVGDRPKPKRSGWSRG
ncbi:MAG: hypothetical protein ACJ763_11980 [Bdellovibrionia bacterium]